MVLRWLFYLVLRSRTGRFRLEVLNILSVSFSDHILVLFSALVFVYTRGVQQAARGPQHGPRSLSVWPASSFYLYYMYAHVEINKEILFKTGLFHDKIGSQRCLSIRRNSPQSQRFLRFIWKNKA